MNVVRTLEYERRIEETLVRQAGAIGERPAIEDGGVVLSYGELLYNACAMASRLSGVGVARGDRVAVFLDKSAEAVACIYGTWLAGAALVPIAPTLRRMQVEHIIAHSESRVLLSTSDKLRRAGFSVEPAGLLHVGSVEVGRSTTTAPVVAAKDDELAAILYTSGSTGAPKGVAISHENLCAGSRILSSALGLRSDDRILSVLPFSFRYGLNQLLKGVHLGACVVLERSTLMDQVCARLRDRRITVLAGVPTFWLQLLNSGLVSRSTAPTLRLIANGGGAFPVEAVKRYRELLPGCEVVLMYGTTEAFRSTLLPPSELARRPSSIGRAVPESEIFVVDEHDKEVAPNEIGELVHRGPTVALGYWRDPAATSAKFRPDPFDPNAKRPVFYTGDLVRRDDEGFLYFVGRSDEMLKISGYRLSPNEVEAIVIQSGLTSEVVVGAVADPRFGARIVIHCVPNNEFTTRALMAYCRREMPPYMVPDAIIVHESFPRTPSGKIDRTKLTGSPEALKP